MRTPLGALGLALALACLAPGPQVAAAPSPVHGSGTIAAAGRAGPASDLAIPALRARRVVTGLSHPWDVQVTGPGEWLITERTSRRLLRRADGEVTEVAFPSASVWASGETGLMSMAVDPRFQRNRRFYTCQGGYAGDGGHDVRVVAWRLNTAGTRASRRDTLLRGIRATSGRHGGCRLLIHSNGALLVGTGDAATGWTPQSLRSLAGKVLRLSRWGGAPWPTNPWRHADSFRKRYVLTYGHRNVQGLAERNDGRVWSVEHGPDRDDEVNRLTAGGNYGWNPVPGYNETVPMTDFSLPGRQIGARWRSGSPTLATSGAAWVRGEEWGGLRGTLAVAALKSSRLVFMKFSQAGRLRWTRAPEAVRRFGRLRSVTQAPDGSLLVTTANGSDDAIVKVRPR